MTTAKKSIREQVPGPTRPPGFTHGVKIGGWVYLSGIRGAGTDMSSQARSSLETLKKTLEEAGTDLDHVAFVTLYLTDLGQRGDFDKVWLEVFGAENPPGRTGVQVSNASTGPTGTSLFVFDVIALAK